MRREIHASSNIFLRKLKSKIEQIMNIKPKAIAISKILSRILSEAVTFDKESHSQLIKLLIDALKTLTSPKTPEFLYIKRSEVIIETIIDFLLRFKDMHPFTDLNENTTITIFSTIMEFLYFNSFKPSTSLLTFYSECKLTKKLNTLPPLEYINSKLAPMYEMSEGDYDLLRK